MRPKPDPSKDPQVRSAIRDRVTELRRVRAGDLIPNPKNWRRHPAAQRDAMRGMLAEIGYADALLAREEAGQLLLIDGHLRAETTPDDIVPVLILDVSAEEGDKLLATLDPLAALAEADAGMLATVIADVKMENEAAAGLIARIAYDHGVTPPSFAPVDAATLSTLDSVKMVTCPSCGHTFAPSERYGTKLS